jgi:putative RNA 2'-phosphotransferase
MKEQSMENKNDNSKNNKWKKMSVFLSLVLRHQPDAAGITLDEHGWADVEELIEGFQKTGRPLDLEMLKEIVRTDEKGRYRMSEDGTLIRANQGHSIPVDVELKETKPPKVLYHGTAERFLPSIMAQGLGSGYVWPAMVKRLSGTSS